MKTDVQIIKQYKQVVSKNVLNKFVWLSIKITQLSIKIFKNLRKKTPKTVITLEEPGTFFPSSFSYLFHLPFVSQVIASLQPPGKSLPLGASPTHTLIIPLPWRLGFQHMNLGGANMQSVAIYFLIYIHSDVHKYVTYQVRYIHLF